jgi:hypothetical protein
MNPTVLVEALRLIAYGAPYEDPCLEPGDSYGNYDDSYWDGMAQQHFNDARIARKALAEWEKGQ